MSYELSAIISIGLENKIIEEFKLKKITFLRRLLSQYPHSKEE